MTVDLVGRQWAQGPKIKLLPPTVITGSGNTAEFVAAGDVDFSDLQVLTAAAFTSSVHGTEPELTLKLQHRATAEDPWEDALTFTIDAKGRTAAQQLAEPKARLRVAWTVTGSTPRFVTELSVTPGATRAFLGTDRPVVETADAASLLAALVELNLVVDDT